MSEECKVVQLALTNIKDLYQPPANPPASLVNHGGIRVALSNCERQFNILFGKLGPILSLAQTSKPDKMKLRARISVVWNRDEIDFLRRGIQGQISALNLLLETLQLRSTQQTNDMLQEVLRILQSPKWKEQLDASSRDTDTLCSIYDKASSMILGRFVTRGAGAESTIGDETFSFDDEIVNAKAYRRNMARHARKVSVASESSSSFSKLFRKALGKGITPPPTESPSSPGSRQNPEMSTADAVECFEEIAPCENNDFFPDWELTAENVRKVEERLRSWAMLKQKILGMKYINEAYADRRKEAEEEAQKMLDWICGILSRWEVRNIADKALGQEDTRELKWLAAAVWELRAAP